ncbi:hypothetical protein [Gloeobacter violaceus]|nr:hypothetical protein [Gloeobacter violaceus]
MLADNDLNSLIQALQSSDDNRAATALTVLIERPTADVRLLPHLEALLTRHSACVIARPFIFGELRLLAARALAEERGAAGILEPVQIEDAAQPLRTTEIELLGKEAGLKTRGGVAGILDAYNQLNALGKLPRKAVNYDPQVLARDAGIRREIREKRAN